MRSFGFLLVFGASFLAVGGGPKTFPDPKVPAQVEPKKDEPKTPAPKLDPLDEEILRRAMLPSEGPALIDFLKQRVLPEKERPDVEALVRQLRAGDYRTRASAARTLVKRGVATLEVLRTAPAKAFDLEQARRIEASIRGIQEKDPGPHVAAAVVRVAALRHPPGLIETLVAYVPFADHEALVDEIRVALTKHALKDGKADPVLVAALTDRAPLRRAVAVEALARVALVEQKDALKKVLSDPEPLVRFRAARALALAHERDAVAVLIDVMPDLPVNAAWQAEDFLLRLAGAAPPDVPMSNDKNARRKCKDAWQAWWKTHGAKVDLAKLQEPPRLLGRTLVVLLDENTVAELGPDNQPRWQLPGINFPLDAQLLGEDRVLVAEHHSNRVTERNLRGEILWQRGVVGPLVAQRLANGNTFVANDHQLLEYDKAGAQVMNISFAEEGRKIMKAAKLDNGQTVCMLADARIVRYDRDGNEVSSFEVQLGQRLFGGRIHILENGRVLMPQVSDGKVIEYDAKGKVIWQAAIESPIAATRLPNGNTLITSMNASIGAVEVDRTGVHVWSYQHPGGSRVTRAIRR